jgi:hypothetical protein
MPVEVTLPTGPAALVVTHPGHELRVHGWLEQVRPLVFVLTDGSGSARESRLAGTDRVLSAAGATPGPVFGRFTDRRWYEAILRQESEVFTMLADDIAEALVREQIEVVVSDAEEGYNSGHDLCRGVVDAAVSIARHVSGRAIASFDFPLVGDPRTAGDSAFVRLRLDEAALQRKIAAACGYPEMASEVGCALQRFGREAFRIECLRRVVTADSAPAVDHEVPFYERFGEQQVAAGLYTDVIRARKHIRPMIGRLHRHARTRAACSRSSSC